MSPAGVLFSRSSSRDENLVVGLGAERLSQRNPRHEGRDRMHLISVTAMGPPTKINGRSKVRTIPLMTLSLAEWISVLEWGVVRRRADRDHDPEGLLLWR
jgi:hypothetical protein